MDTPRRRRGDRRPAAAALRGPSPEPGRMTGPELPNIAQAVAANVLDELSNQELVALYLCVATDADPRGKGMSDEVLALFFEVGPGDIPRMSAELRRVLDLVYSERFPG